ncbi:Protein of unknown function [Thermomonospora echinospora]|uniref:DUF742 domain-containing protein n=1 Tax=Thermomonospora echinospora TaxID=1992 RepID=A0A1H5VKJ7_9ACTN|nr:DUF742 domain-containing protein [Thermomonospora echinospora]SEF87740.1 Protein of unknown function [Thermomonospora echinospora]
MRQPFDPAEPMVRPYVLTRGRVQPGRGSFDVITQVVAVSEPPSGDHRELSPEHLEILRLCQEPRSVAELAAQFGRVAEEEPEPAAPAPPSGGLPISVVRVLLGDLLEHGHIEIQEPEADNLRRIDLYKEIIVGLRAL